MGLNYRFSFEAPATVSERQLVTFLKKVELEAQRLGFAPTTVLNVAFETPDRIRFARRLTTGLTVTGERLKKATLRHSPRVFYHDPTEGVCRLLPGKGIVLVVTDERAIETVFGFYQYPEQIKDDSGSIVAESSPAGCWHFSEFICTPDPRYRRIVGLFREAGFLQEEQDDFLPAGGGEKQV